MLSPFPGFAMVPSAAVSVMLWVPTSWYISGFCMFLHHSRRYTLCRINAIVSPWATVSHREPPWVRVSEILPSGLYSLCSTEVNLQTKRSLNKTFTFYLVSHSIQSTCPGSLCLHIMYMYVYYIYIYMSYVALIAMWVLMCSCMSDYRAHANLTYAGPTHICDMHSYTWVCRRMHTGSSSSHCTCIICVAYTGTHLYMYHAYT